MQEQVGLKNKQEKRNQERLATDGTHLIEQ